MGFWKFVLFILISGIFGYIAHSWWSGILLFVFICLINGLVNWVSEGIL